MVDQFPFNYITFQKKSKVILELLLCHAFPSFCKQYLFLHSRHSNAAPGMLL
ncbi:hypothetical protein RUMCAL_02253 [Ruminococcus callidus ATCC 27760]|uniref:Uncharacterized protein n=1 Tax=Ruminococcus callidus ATCC 27760 TaxID=411473 RepID=U2KNH1_9FIRM|nr:hypothetical protein RUMCAL_02253 [Ruminococcus callidus ATCC 27760]